MIAAATLDLYNAEAAQLEFDMITDLMMSCPEEIEAVELDFEFHQVTIVGLEDVIKRLTFHVRSSVEV